MNTHQLISISSDLKIKLNWQAHFQKHSNGPQIVLRLDFVLSELIYCQYGEFNPTAMLQRVSNNSLQGVCEIWEGGFLPEWICNIYPQKHLNLLL